MMGTVTSTTVRQTTTWGQRRAQSSLLLPLLVAMMMTMIAVTATVGHRERRRWPHGMQKGGGWTQLEEKRLLHALKHLLLIEKRSRDAFDNNSSYDDDNDYYSNPEVGRIWMARTNDELLHWNAEVAKAEWDMDTNITTETQNKYQTVMADFNKWNEPRLVEGRKFRVDSFDPDLQRQFQIFTLSAEIKDSDKVRRKVQLKTDMITTYSTAKVCFVSTDQRSKQHRQSDPAQNECLSLQPDLENILVESRDPHLLQAVWEGWREVAGRPQRQRYQEYVELLNQGARDNGFTDYSDYSTKEQFLGDIDLEGMVSELWEQLRPLYLELHAYVRGRLRHHYGTDMSTDGTIPAHLLGNMWAQSWENIFPLVAPFPDLANASNNVDHALKERYGEGSGNGRDGVYGLFELAQKFYTSVGLFHMTNKFWALSMLQKPADREVRCHASAYNMFRPGDFRIKMCTSVNAEYLKTIHHEMGHVEYYMAYAHQPTIYRDSPNQAFHEAVGDTTTLAVMSRKHLMKLGLAPVHSDNENEEDINNLMQMALEKIAFLPFSLVVERWRWQVFRGQTSPSNYNHDWWKLRLDLQGLRSPVPRSEEDFDPAAKMHVASNSPYIRYFLAHVVQFQFYKRLCQVSGHRGPLHHCDFGGSLQAGAVFRTFLALGASQPWQEALQSFIGSPHISAQPMLEYFEPLRKWMKQHNEDNSESLGWDKATINW